MTVPAADVHSSSILPHFNIYFRAMAFASGCFTSIALEILRSLIITLFTSIPCSPLKIAWSG